MSLCRSSLSGSQEGRESYFRVYKLCLSVSLPGFPEDCGPGKVCEFGRIGNSGQYLPWVRVNLAVVGMLLRSSHFSEFSFSKSNENIRVLLSFMKILFEVQQFVFCSPKLNCI